MCGWAEGFFFFLTNGRLNGDDEVVNANYEIDPICLLASSYVAAKTAHFFCQYVKIFFSLPPSGNGMRVVVNFIEAISINVVIISIIPD